jgi:hypothetical protein
MNSLLCYCSELNCNFDIDYSLVVAGMGRAVPTRRPVAQHSDAPRKLLNIGVVIASMIVGFLKKLVPLIGMLLPNEQNVSFLCC